jgi:hypothetical protein
MEAAGSASVAVSVGLLAAFFEQSVMSAMMATTIATH